MNLTKNNNEAPDFYLVPGEGGEPQGPTACWFRGRLRDSHRDDYMLVSIDPGIAGQKYGLGAQDVDQLILSTQLAGTSLYSIQKWPCHVYVMRIKNDSISTSHFIRKEDVEMISWGLLYPTKEAALRAVLS